MTETARTPQTFDEWKSQWSYRIQLSAGNIDTVEAQDQFARAAWDAALASQQAEIKKLIADKVNDGRILIGQQAEIDRLTKKLLGAEWIERNLRQNIREREDWYIASKRDLEAQLRAAREALTVIREEVELARLDYPAPSWFWTAANALAKYDRLTTSEDKG